MPLPTLTVTQVNTFIKSLLEGDGRLHDILVTGEISNFTRNARSGHLYFSLKDQNSLLKAVMFATSARRLKFLPTDGLKVLVRGRISVYEPSGQYQLYAEDIQPLGAGALGLAFEQLKARLAAEGLFDAEHKRPLPKYPQRIGVITSPTGAAVRDILQVTARRWPLAEILFYPVPVQGDEAPSRLTAAVKALGSREDCDVIILGRGGGSAEDLWAFNDEALVRAVYASKVPVISAVGHEIDYTLCDFAADMRAPTPSAAAELCTPDYRQELLHIGTLNNRLYTFVKRYQYRVGELTGRLLSSYTDKLEAGKSALSLLSGRLDALSPLKVLARGFSVVTDEQGNILTDAAQTEVGETLRVRMARGSLKATITERQDDDNAQ